MGQQGANRERGGDQNLAAGTADLRMNGLAASKSFSIPGSGCCRLDITEKKLILLDLPNECLQSIAEFLKSERDINAFAQTNDRLYSLLNTYLYRHNVHFGSLALLWAASRGQDATAKKLLAEGANVQAVDGHSRTPLLLAAMNGHEAVVKLLLATEAVNPQSKDSDGRTSLILAVKYCYEGVVKLLLATESVNLESKDFEGRKPLILAVQNRCETMKHLIQDTADIEAKDEFGGTLLTSAIENGSEKICQILLDKGAKVGYHYILPYSLDDYTIEHNGEDLYMLNSENRDSSGIHLSWSIDLDLFSHGGVTHHYYRTPLSRASERGCARTVKVLLKHPDIDVNVEDGDGRTPLWWATEEGHDTVVRLLLKKGAALLKLKDSKE
ncbi:hypothetical protein MMC17_008135 [Xylographa soralifera]|nr:hypothetical protein [Xylographa soralifera]